MRPEQWLKNGFVLAPIVFSGLVGDTDAWFQTILAVVAFCAASSAVYLVNDVFDRQADRQHPVKQNRPIASGEVSVATALVVAVALVAGAIAISIWLGGWFPAILIAYIGLVLLYSAVLNRRRCSRNSRAGVALDPGCGVPACPLSRIG
jgi:decaprenyl-phosphate phosphoribosyltransferase